MELERTVAERHSHLRGLGLLLLALLLLLLLLTGYRFIMQESEAPPPAIRRNLHGDSAAPKYDFSQDLQLRQRELSLQPQPLTPAPEALPVSSPVRAVAPSGRQALQVRAYREEAMAQHHAAQFAEKYGRNTAVTPRKDVSRKDVFWVDFVGLSVEDAAALQETLAADGVKSWPLRE